MILSKQLKFLEKKMMFLATTVEENFRLAIQAFVSQDTDLAEKVILSDQKIDELEIDVEEECLKTLALYQPVAVDLRMIVSILKINKDLERIGDLSESLAKRTKKIANASQVFHHSAVQDMLNVSFDMFRKSLDAFVNKDVDLARKVSAMDENVDNMQKQLYKDLEIKIDSSSLSGELILAYYSLTHSIERIADLSVNICEDLIYWVEGNVIRHQ